MANKIFNIGLLGLLTALVLQLSLPGHVHAGNCTNCTLSNKIVDEVANDPRISKYSLSVHQTPTEILLEGKVNTLRGKNAIEEIAQRLSGEKRVVSALEIDNIRTSLKVISQSELKERIKHISETSNPNVEIVFDRGVARVDGDFESFQDVDMLFSRLRNVPGIMEIVSNVTVNGKDYSETVRR